MKKFTRKKDFDAIVIGCSAGGMDALKHILSSLPINFPFPVIIVQHRHVDSDGYLAVILNDTCSIPVKEVEDKEPLRTGIVYLAPSNYHVLLEKNRHFALSIDEKVNYTRPSIDILFESAANVFQERLVGIILTGANHDGSQGLKRIQEQGGETIVQDPDTAEYNTMPLAALKTANVDHILGLQKISNFLNDLV